MTLPSSVEQLDVSVFWSELKEMNEFVKCIKKPSNKDAHSWGLGLGSWLGSHPPYTQNLREPPPCFDRRDPSLSPRKMAARDWRTGEKIFWLII